MAVFKCKMCGGTIEFEQGATVGVCDSCGSRQTLPKLDDDKKANLYDRANHFRRNNDYDKAMGIYEQILNEDGSDAEAYWSLVLCRYGIEYVEDPATHKRVPTVNRAQFTSIFDDEDYKSALAHADMTQKMIYEEEAAAINEIQKGILAISQKEEPFDVFICYKETDNDGRRTQDSVLANDLYHQLTQEGFKVFFSRITLEDKLGTAYEPYIFAALNSAKVMVVLGTKPEYFNAVWVKNEWSRYLALIRNGAKKMLIPAYRDMDPYDLPEEFSHLQAQDMSKLGFMQDLIRGIKKIVGTDEPKQTVKETVVVSSGNANTEPLLKRAFMFLEDGNWQEADEYCERVLDIDPECAEAYLGKLLAELKVRKPENLKNCENPLSESNNYNKAIRYGNEKLVKQLKEYEEFILNRNEQNRLEEIYIDACEFFDSAETQEEYENAAIEFEDCIDYKDSKQKKSECLEKAEACRKDKIYDEAIANIKKGYATSYESALEMLRTIPGWRDADEQAQICEKTIENIHKKEEERTRKNKKIAKIVIPLACVAIVIVVLMTNVIIPNGKYNDAIALMNENNLDEAYSIFLELGDYKDAADKANKLKVQCGEIEAGDYIEFGAYEQDNDKSNGRENIEWLVLKVKDKKALIISKCVLDCKRFAEAEKAVTWKDSNVRAWLNDEFYNKAFKECYKGKIIESTIDDVDYNGDKIKLQDKIFLLSDEEVEKYCTDSQRECKATAYAIDQGAREISYERSYWYTRTTIVLNSNERAIWTGDGDVDLLVIENGPPIEIRPAMWVSIE